MAVCILFFLGEADIDAIEENCKELGKDLNWLVNLMFWIHFACYIFMQISMVHSKLPKPMRGCSKHLGLVAMPLIQGAVLYIFDFITYEKEVCVGKLGQLEWWIKIEVYVFYIYMALTPWVLLKSRFFNSGLVKN